MTNRMLAAAALVLATAAPAAAEVAVTLRGSPESMVRQNRVARESEAAFFRTPEEVLAAVEAGALVPVEGNENLHVNRISFPYARAETRLFLERFSEAYRAACGEQLVVTSLTRPASRQPSNAHRLSVHPTGLALDLRVSQSAECRGYLERTLLALEGEGVLDVTRERTPPHYHVAIFPDAYLAYVGEIEPEMAEPGDMVPFAPASLEPLADGFRAGAGAAEPAETRGLSGWIERILTLPVRLFQRFRA